MIFWRAFLVGVFLTPFTRLLPIQNFGFSVGDALLIVGGLGVLAVRSARHLPRVRSPRWAAAFTVPAMLIIVGTLVSALVNQSVGLMDTATLVTQYGVAMVFLPLVLAQLPASQLSVIAKTFVYGLAASVAIGLLIATYIPTLEAYLAARGFMYSVGSGRHGLFAGVGELSKMAAMSVPLVYYLVMRSRLSLWRGGVLLAALLVAVVVTRSASGAGTVVVALIAVALMHFALRPRIRSQARVRVTGRATVVLVCGLAIGAYIIRQLDSSGAGYTAKFNERITSPLELTGVSSVGSAQVRLDLVREAWSIIRQHPVTGIGPGLYDAQSEYLQGVHVVPLKLWAETGLLPVGGWVVLVAILAVATVSIARQSPIAATAAAGVLAAWLVTNLTAPYIYGRGLFFPMLMGFFLLSDYRTDDNPRSVPRPPRRAVFDKVSDPRSTTGSSAARAKPRVRRGSHSDGCTSSL